VRPADAVGVLGDAVHDVGHRHLARAAHVAVVAGRAHVHALGVQHFLALAGADQHEDFLGRMIPAGMEVGGAGAGTQAALHAHLHPLAHLRLLFNFLQEIVFVAVGHLCIHIAHGRSP
jgi:hypothetical protein